MEEGEIPADNSDEESLDSDYLASLTHGAENQNKPQRSPKVPPIKIPADSRADPCISPDYPGKRRRIQHDYRRLSSSGYADDYVGREKRFSSDSEVSTSPTPPKVKGTNESLLNGTTGENIHCPDNICKLFFFRCFVDAAQMCTLERQCQIEFLGQLQQPQHVMSHPRLPKVIRF